MWHTGRHFIQLNSQELIPRLMSSRVTAIITSSRELCLVDVVVRYARYNKRQLEVHVVAVDD